MLRAPPRHSSLRSVGAGISRDVSAGSRLAAGCPMAVVFLVLFPLLILINPPLAASSLLTAIVLLYRKKASPTRHPRHRPTDDAAI